MTETTIQEQIERYNKTLKQEKTISNRYSIIRFLLLFAFFFTLYYGYYKNSFFYVLMICALILFFWFVKIHRDLKKEIEFNEVLIECHQDMLKRKKEDWKEFKDCGDEFLTNENTQAFDLDIFGHASLFQYLCVAKTIKGRELLASLLTPNKVDYKEIIKRQEAVHELCLQNMYSLELIALLKLFERHGRKKKKQSIQDVYDYMENEKKVIPGFMSVVVFVFTILTLGLFLLAFNQIVSYAYGLMCAGISISLAMLCYLKTSAIFSSVKALDHMMEDYERIFVHIEKGSFHSEGLVQPIQECKNASGAIQKLHHIMMGVSMRNDGILFILFNGLFQIDFHCVIALEKWKETYGKQLRTWLNNLAILEAYVSLAQMELCKTKSCYPTIMEEDNPQIHMIQGIHPLINEKQAISNDFDAYASSYTITGSNMSGKTTFLRTLGLNMILFHAGSAVCAKSFQANSMNIYTSMRIRDDVSEGISTFYAEILRIKEMINESAKKENMLLLIDEIFKGTNSADRIYCAKEVLQQLHAPWILSLVSTHDFELCTVAFKDGEKTNNYHFSETYENDEIQFDYRLKEGRCTTTNAKELLRLAGIH